MTQQQRIADCEKAIATIYAMIQAIINKLDDNKETKHDTKISN